MTRIFWLLSLVLVSSVLLATLPAVVYAEVDEHTVAIWFFDEGTGDIVEDASGNGHDGNFIGEPEWIDGKNGKGLSFNGNSASYVEVPHADDLNLAEWTIEGWFLTRSLVGKSSPAGWDCPFSKETANPSNRNYAFHIQGSGNQGMLQGSVTIANSFGFATFGATSVVDSKWHYLAATYDGNNCLLYFDGETDFESSIPTDNGKIGGPADFNEGPVTIGAKPAQNYTYDGIMDEIRLSSIARTQEEIKRVMEKGLKALINVDPGGKLATTWSQIKTQD